MPLDVRAGVWQTLFGWNSVERLARLPFNIAQCEARCNRLTPV
jgi:hypothetical protein